MNPSEPQRPDVIDAALAEDFGTGGDLATGFFVPPETTATARIVAREHCILAGIETAAEVFRRVGPDLRINPSHADGDLLEPGALAMEISGRARPILSAERTALNFVQHLSGVATLTARYVRELMGTRARLLDTRKTLPGLRALEKAAVRAGGGHNHRMGLYDMAMIKDNHLAAIGGLSGLAEAVAAFREKHPGIRVEVEADTVEQALEFFKIPGIDVVLLDNMAPASIRCCVAARPPGIELEASGGVTLATIREIALTGVNWISVGSITRSAPSVDFGLDFV